MQLPKTFPCNYFESNACKCFVTFLAELYSKLKKTPLLSEHIKITQILFLQSLTQFLHSTDYPWKWPRKVLFQIQITIKINRTNNAKNKQGPKIFKKLRIFCCLTVEKQTWFIDRFHKKFSNISINWLYKQHKITKTTTK